jgi:hypothetical protein
MPRQSGSGLTDECEDQEERQVTRNPHIAIYGRHSAGQQNPTPIADQAACVQLVDMLGGTVVGTYSIPKSPASGATGPGSAACWPTSVRA